MTGFGFTDEQPVLLADGGGPDGILDGVVVDLDSAIFEIDGEHGPQREGVVDGFTHRALREVAASELHSGERTADAIDDHAALAGSHGLPLLRPRFGFAELFFDAVEVLDLQKHPPGLLRCAFGGPNELAPGMYPARGQGDAAFAAIGERWIGGVAVALHGATEVGGDDAVQTSRGATGGPGEADAAQRGVRRWGDSGQASEAAGALHRAKLGRRDTQGLGMAETNFAKIAP